MLGLGCFVLGLRWAAWGSVRSCPHACACARAWPFSSFAVAWGGMSSRLAWVSWHWALDVTGEGFGPLLHECAAALADVDAGCRCEHALTRESERGCWFCRSCGGQLIGWACYLVSVLKSGMVWG
jgi:hypothetical protein